MINLFEYQNKVKLESQFDGLEEFLDEIWLNREKNNSFFDDESDKIESQQFLQFLHKTQELKSNKFVGVIRYNGETINLLPKIFFDPEREYSNKELNQIHNHVLWWLSYCRKIKFPNYQSSLNSTKSNFFEVLIYVFSKYTRELLSSSIYQQYQEINREFSFIKGRLNTSEYINQNIGKGNWHKLNCTFDAFVLDNKFNRIIKHVTTLLFNASNNLENKKFLREILFILDEVTDVKVGLEECSRIHFNPMFKQFEIVKDYCELFLKNCVSFGYKNELKLFAFLLPMEYVFEDFIFGFIDKELDEITSRAQRSDTYLVDDLMAFKLKPDLWLKTLDKSLIADTKYKIVYSDENDPKKGISQNDLYQMIAYAIRFEITEVILFFPNTIKNYQHKVAELKIKDELAQQEIVIKAFQLPVINEEILSKKMDQNLKLEELFEPAKINLTKKLEAILTPKN